MTTCFKIIDNQPFEDYQINPGINHSLLKEIRKSPLHLQWAKNYPRKQTDSMDIGTLTHSLVFEEAQLNREYAVMPDYDLRTTEGKKNKEKWLDRNLGKKIIKESVYNPAARIAENVRKHPLVAPILKSLRKEMSVYFELQGVACKARIDGYSESTRTVIDLKTTKSAARSVFEKSIFQYGYHTQMAWYREALLSHNIHADFFVLIAAENSSPYGIRLYELEPDAIEAGRVKCLEWLSIYAECEQNNKWPGYPDVIETIGLPIWAQRIEEEGNE